MNHTWSTPTKEAKGLAKLLTERLLKGDSLQQAMQIPDETLQAFYDYSQDLFVEGRFEDSDAVLFVISLLAPDRPAIWISQGLAQEKLHQYSAAQMLFEHASILDPTLAEPYYFAAVCALAQNDKEAAKSYLASLQEFGDKRKEDAHIVGLAKSLAKELSHG